MNIYLITSLTTGDRIVKLILMEDTTGMGVAEGRGGEGVCHQK